MHVHIRFYEELNTFLKNTCQNKWITRHIKATTSAKDLIESSGVPHPEVDVILINGVASDFHYLVLDEDKIEVYPVLSYQYPKSVIHLQQRPLRNARFIADGHLGKMTRYLRLLGFDVAYSANAEDIKILNFMQSEDRALLTRDRRLLMHRVVRHGYCPRSDQAESQVVEVVHRFGLKSSLKPFSLCLNCNGLLKPVEKSEILDQLEPLTRKFYNDFVRCNTCDNIYWQGSHYEHLINLIDKIQNESAR